MSERSVHIPESVRQYPLKRKPHNDAHPTDQAGEALIVMLQQAARLSSENCDRMMDMAHDLSRQLEAAQDRVNGLQNDVAHFRARAAGAEKWLELIQKEIEERLMRPMET